ncbi:prolyl oligopeptidase family serine peptidase, partial [bacterium]|nr:prolyl oligopeptidase family serine peptidase [bacterium]
MTQLSARYAAYPSRLDPGLQLFGRFVAAGGPAPVLLRMHGWHGSVKETHRDNVEPSEAGLFHEIHPEMRGRGDSRGRPDANGYELQDAVDALAAGSSCLGPGCDPAAAPLLWGGSGGGGNVLGLVGKFPDLFAAAVAECGISDYALWFAHDQVGEFRDELEGAGKTQALDQPIG